MKLNDGKEKKEKKAKAPKSPKASKPAGEGMKKAKICIIIAAVIVALIAAAAAAGVIYVSTIDDIYPNVTLDGIALGDMSLTEAAAVLDEAGYGDQTGKELNVLLPLDFVLNVKAEEVCTETPIAELVQRVYDGCTAGNPVEDALTFIKCSLTGMSFESEVLITADADAVRAKVDNIVQELKLALLSSEITIGEDTIAVIKGARGVILDADEIVALVVEALESENYSDIVYEAEIDTDQELDIAGLHSTVFCEPKDAEYDKETGTTLEHIVGIDFDTAEAEKLWNAAEYGDTVEIPLIITEPELTTEKFNELLFRDVLSESETNLWGSSESRINNVRKAVSSINGTILLPGEEFDYNATLGQRTAENGYLPAPAYSGGQTVLEYGGGICQISSMTYYCALHANLKITDRTCHYFNVGYIPTGLDATVSWGGPEFKFVNDRDYPIKIEAYVKDDNSGVVMRILGSDIDGSYVVMNVGTWLVYDEKYTDVAIGYKAFSRRSVFNADGTLRSATDEALSYYHYHDEDIKWPEESPSPSPSTEPSPSPSAEPTPTPTPEATPPAAETPVQPPVSEAPVETPTPPAEETPAPTPETPVDTPAPEAPPAEAPAE